MSAQTSTPTPPARAISQPQRVVDGVTERIHNGTLQPGDRVPPEPELMREFGAEPERTLMIGDTTHDLQMAKNARTAGLAVSFGAHPVAALEAEAPLACVHAPGELARWLLENA